MESTKILVCAHKEGFMKSDEIFMPVQGGKAIATVDLGIQGDDTGENISNKNARYAELTVLYWAWKNQKNVNYIGLCHYRRYFKFSPFPFRGLKIMTVDKFLSAKDTQFNPNKHLSKKYDIILIKPRRWSYPIHLTITSLVCFHDYLLLKKIINNSFHDYYDSFCYIMEHNNKIYSSNMFITRWETFDNYCSWLFAVLGELEKVSLNIANSTPERRDLGILGEFLLSVYVFKHKLKVKSYPIIKLADGVKSPSLWKGMIHFFTSNIAFQISQPLKWWFKRIPR
jgi:hypothetical protein